MLSGSKLYFGSCWKPGWSMPTHTIKHCHDVQVQHECYSPFLYMSWESNEMVSSRFCLLVVCRPYVLSFLWPFVHEQNLVSLLISPFTPSLFCLPLSFWWKSCPVISIPSWPVTKGYIQQSSKNNVSETERASSFSRLWMASHHSLKPKPWARIAQLSCIIILACSCFNVTALFFFQYWRLNTEPQSIREVFYYWATSSVSHLNL